MAHGDRRTKSLLWESSDMLTNRTVGLRVHHTTAQAPISSRFPPATAHQRLTPLSPSGPDEAYHDRRGSFVDQEDEFEASSFFSDQLNGTTSSSFDQSGYQLQKSDNSTTNSTTVGEPST